ncbi:MAG: M1 family metallopeptidase [Acidobacteriota bacterium]
MDIINKRRKNILDTCLSGLFRLSRLSRLFSLFSLVSLFGGNTIYGYEKVVDYRIKAQLFPEKKEIKGEEILVWKNVTSNSTDELYFHMYLNAFKNEWTTFIKEAKGIPKKFKITEDDWGWIKINSFAINGKELSENFERKARRNPAPSGAGKASNINDKIPCRRRIPANYGGVLQYVSSDDGNPYDQTVLKVKLPEAVPPQSSAEVKIDFISKLPRIIARTGFHRDDFFMVAQWFPKIGVLEEKGWNCHQYHRNSEYYADFGDYEVEIIVPEKYGVVATGKKLKEIKNKDGTISRIFSQDRVHDFAWCASKYHKIFIEDFSLENPPLKTKMILFLHPEHFNQRERYSVALKRAIEFYSKNYGPYPYETITLVDPAPGAMGAGGMEYPTLITAGTSRVLPKGMLFPELVTVHEFGHQFWYGISANNEFEEAWLDEGMNSYSEAKAMTEYWGEKTSVFNFKFFKIGDIDFQRFGVITSRNYDPIYKKSWEYISGGSYGINSYQKPAVMLLTLENYLGKETFSKVMKTYFEIVKFTHPKTEDFIKTAEEVSGKDLRWFFDQVLFGSGSLDYGIESIMTKKVKKPRGKFDVKIEDMKKEMWESEVTVVRYGEVIFPQEILVVFENGEKVFEKWDGKEKWKKFSYKKPNRVKYAQVDPHNKILLDRNTFNNSKLAKKNLIFPLREAIKGTFRFQMLLSFICL